MVSIYTTPSCGYCKMAKQFMQEQGVEYQEYDVSADSDKRKEMMEKSGQMGVPVIEVGEDIMVGFDKAKLSKMLGLEE